MQRMARFVMMVALLAGGLALLPVGMASATDAVVSAPCGEAEFDAALATVQGSGGGLITFDCGGAATITFSAEKVIESDVQIDGAGLITLSGGDVTRHFQVLEGGSLTLERLVLEDGFGADGIGGAIQVWGGGTLNVLDSTLRSNHGSLGGAIYLRAFDSYASATISGSTLIENEAPDGLGGAIFVDGASRDTDIGATLTIRDSLLADNFADAGGAISIGGGTYDQSVGATVTITNSSLLRNAATDSSGGAIFNGGGIYDDSVGASLIITGSTLADNTAEWHGGAIFNDGAIHGNSTGATADIRESTLSGNQAGHSGGAIWNSSGIYDNATGGAITLVNSTLSGNTADEFGGAIYNEGTNPSPPFTGSGGTMTIRASTIIDNDSLIDEGDGIYTASGTAPPVTILRLSIVAENDTDAGGVDCRGTISSNGRNLDSDDTCQLTRIHDIPAGNAGLGPLADNGGPTETHLPGETSDALDAGPATCMAADQRQLPRPYGPACDIGAVEVQPLVQPVTLCVSRFTTQVYTLGVCDPATYYEVVMPNLAPQTFCIDAADALSHASGGICPVGRTPHVTPADGDLLTCVSLFTAQHRVVSDHSQCIGGSEYPLVIPA